MDYAFSLLKDFKPTTINHMSMVNAALRPSGKSYRDRMIAGIHNENPSEEIDKLLESNNGYLIFQEDTIKFLTDICDFTGSAADTTRRAIGKKDEKLLKEQLPKILDGYCNHSPKERSIAEQEAKQFVQIVQDSSDYQFGYNHSTAYSMNGYECVWLRTYYPLEFMAAYLNRAENKEDINYGVELANQYHITINPIRFGKSSAEYTIDKKNNAIYKGIESIKYCNAIIAEEMLKLSQGKKYSSFIELLDDILNNTTINNRQLKILTGLNFFSDFGKNKYLLNVIDLYNGIEEKDPITKKNKKLLPSLRNCSVIKKDKIEQYSEYGLSEYLLHKYSAKETPKQYGQIDNVGLLNEMIDKLPKESMSIQEYVKFEKEFLQYVTYTNEDVADFYYIIVDYKTFKDETRPHVVLRNIKTGEETKSRIKEGKIYRQSPFGEFSILKIPEFTLQYKKKPINGEWLESDELENILTQYEVVKR